MVHGTRLHGRAGLAEARTTETNVWTEEEVLTRDTLNNNKAIKTGDRVSEQEKGWRVRRK